MTIRGENVGYVGLSLIDRIGEFRTGFLYTVDIGETYTTYMIRVFRPWDTGFYWRYIRRGISTLEPCFSAQIDRNDGSVPDMATDLTK